MPTLRDVAAACGVSPATVSKALNNAPDVGQETAQRIRQRAKELGYHPNAVARTLKTNRSYSIGVLFEDEMHSGLTHEFFSSVLDALKNGVESRGYDVTFISKNLGAASMSYLDHCRYRNCDGVVIANVDFRDPSVAELVASGIPAVTIDYVFDGTSAVMSDNARGMRDLVTYVHSQGHRDFALIHGEETAVTRVRMASFYRTCRDLGITVRPDLVIRGQFNNPEACGLVTRSILERRDRPTCIFYPDDIALLGGMTEIERWGLRIPEDISVAGYDGIKLSRFLRPELATLCQDTQAMGSEAARLLTQAIEENKAFMPQVVMVPGSLQPGGTVAKLHSQSTGIEAGNKRY